MNTSKGILKNGLTAALLLCMLSARADTILLFVSHEHTYYSEYVVMKEALEASGYTVDVRSASAQDFSIYMSPYNDIPGAANSLAGSSYSAFQSQFYHLFGQPWDESNNAIAPFATPKGSLLEVSSIDDYAGIVVVGGTGALAYRVDGQYESQGFEERQISATVVQQTAEYLNQLAIDALVRGKPVMAQCHGASLPAFWRIPDTSGSNHEVLGFSLLKGEISAGYPETETNQTLANLDVTYRPEDRVVISSPHSSLADGFAGTNRILTTRDWYPQTVAHAARTFLNVLETYPSDSRKETELSALVLHGGPVDPEDCGPGNKDNDVPCNHGLGENLPADYTDLMAVLGANPASDDFSIIASDLDLSQEEAELPFDPHNEEEILSYLADFETIVFFKHWSTYLTNEMLQAIVAFSDNGGGVVGLHHALYNDQHGEQDKDILVSQLFGAESSPSGWAANLANFNLYTTNHGHFISSYLISYDQVGPHPEISSWTTDPLPATANTSFSTLPYLNVFDELYVNFRYTGDIALGRAINEITPLFSHNARPPVGSPSQTRQAGFTRLVDLDDNGVVGKVAYMALGERKESINPSSTYGQMIRNAVVWSASEPAPVEMQEQVISFDDVGTKFVNDEPFDLSANTTSGLTLDYKIVSGPAALDGQTVTLDGNSGTVEVLISQAGNEIYLPANLTVFFTVEDVAKQSQTITFEALEDRTIEDGPILLEALASSGLPVDISVISGPASWNGTALSLTGTGTVILTANQSGDDTYNPAPMVERSFEVSRANQLITFESVPDRTYGDAPFTLEASTSSNLPIEFAWVSGPAVLDGALITLSGAGTVVVTAKQAGNESYHPAASVERAFTVNKADQTILFSEIDDQPMNSEPLTLVAEASSGLPVEFSVEGPASIHENVLTLDGSQGTVTVTAFQSGNANYHETSQQQSFESEYVLGLNSWPSGLVLYPNPVEDQLNVKGAGPGLIQIEVYHPNGVIALRQTIREEGILDIRTLSKGLFLLKIIEKENVTTTKILVSR